MSSRTQVKRTVGGAALALAVVTVVVANEERSFHVNRVGDGLAKTVSGERHVERFRAIKILINTVLASSELGLELGSSSNNGQAFEG